MVKALALPEYTTEERLDAIEEFLVAVDLNDGQEATDRRLRAIEEDIKTLARAVLGRGEPAELTASLIELLR